MKTFPVIVLPKEKLVDTNGAGIGFSAFLKGFNVEVDCRHSQIKI